MVQVVWARELGLVLGSDFVGISIAVALSLLGIAAGSWWGAHRDLELEFTLRGAAVAATLTHGWVAYLLPEWSTGWSSLANPVVKLVVASPIAVVAFLAGAVIPAWFRAQEQEHAVRRAGVLIAALDIGSAFGALATPLFLLPRFGSLGAAVTAIGCFLAASWLAPPSVPCGESPARPARAAVRVALAGLVGAVGFGLEIVWCRLLGEVLGTSLLVLGIAATALLVGGAIGSRLAPVLLRLWSARAVLSVTAAAWVLAQSTSGLLISRLPVLYLSAVEQWGSAAVPYAKAVLTVAPMVAPALFAGFILPVLIAAWCQGRAQLAREAGVLNAALLLGGAVGVTVVGLAVVPTFGSGIALAVLAGATLLLVFAPAALTPSAHASGKSGVIPVALTAVSLLLAGFLGWNLRELWDRELLGAGVFQWSREDIAAGDALGHWRQREILYSGEGRLARVTIEKSEHQNTVFLRVGGRVEGTVPLREQGGAGLASLADMPTQLQLALMPALEGAGDGPTLVIGLGGGTTVATVVEATTGPVTALEVEPEVVAALESPAGREAFRWETERLFDHERAPELVLEDGRAYLHRSEAGKWKAIVCQPSEPWLPWSAPLFTAEFYRLVRSRLAPDGVAVHWLQLHRIGEREFAAILEGFRESFPDVRVFHPRIEIPTTGQTILTGEVLLVGGGKGLPLRERIQVWDSEPLRRCRVRLADALPYPVPLLDSAGVDRWLQGRPAPGHKLRERLEFELPLLGDRGEDRSQELLESLLAAQGSL